MQFNGTSTPPSRKRRKKTGFTLVEVMVAFSVLIIGLCGSLYSITKSLVAVDMARCSTLAAQVMQSQIENLRLANWNSITDPSRVPCLLQNDLNIPVTALLPNGAQDVARRFTLKQSIAIDTDPERQNILNIKLSVTWMGHGNISHTRTFSTRYCKEGIYNYYATAR